MIEHKIIITGTMGVGKTTAINAISEIKPVSTDVINTDSSVDKEKTTVAYDYGEVTLDAIEKLRVYGTPGQQRFSFMWKILARGAMGVIILVDYSRNNPFDDLAIYIKNFEKLIQETACVVGISKLAKEDQSQLDKFAKFLASHGVICPVLAVDVREKQQVLELFDLLLMQLYI